MTPAPIVAALALALVFGLILGLGQPTAAQATSTSTTLDDRVQILGVDEGEREVVVQIAVPPAIGSPEAVAGDFAVTDGGVLIDVEVSRVSSAADVVLVIDTSGSMRGSAMEAAKAAAARFVEAAPPDARVGLISFGDTVVVRQSPSLDRAETRARLDQLQATGEETALWDALVVAADTVADAAADLGTGSVTAAGERPSSVVVLSDGDDTFSGARPVDVVERFARSATVLYAVAIESSDTDLIALEQTVVDVDGQFLATTDLGQLDTLYTDIAGRLANRYRLRFPPAQRGERSVVVAVKAQDGGVATARTTIGRVLDGPTPAPGRAPGPAAGPPPMLNLGDQPSLGVVVVGPPGPLANPSLFWVGLGSMFAALVLTGFTLVRPRARVALRAAASADQLVGFNVRVGRLADRMVSRHDRAGRLDQRLEAADIDVRPGEFLVAWSVATVVVAFGLGALAGLGVAVLAAVVSVVGAWVLLGLRASRRRAKFADQLTETLGIVASSLRAGQSLPRSIELVASEASSPTAEEFNRIAFEVRVGRDLTESIRNTAVRMANPDLDWLAQAVDINRTMGGDLSEILDNLTATIRERRSVARQVDALSAEGRATGWLLLTMPVAVFFFTLWRTPESAERMLTEPVGRLLLGIAVAGMVIGAVWMRRLVKISY